MDSLRALVVSEVILVTGLGLAMTVSGIQPLGTILLMGGLSCSIMLTFALFMF